MGICSYRYNGTKFFKKVLYLEKKKKQKNQTVFHNIFPLKPQWVVSQRPERALWRTLVHSHSSPLTNSGHMTSIVCSTQTLPFNCKSKTWLKKTSLREKLSSVMNGLLHRCGLLKWAGILAWSYVTEWGQHPTNAPLTPLIWDWNDLKGSVGAARRAESMRSTRGHISRLHNDEARVCGTTSGRRSGMMALIDRSGRNDNWLSAPSRGPSEPPERHTLRVLSHSGCNKGPVLRNPAAFYFPPSSPIRLFVWSDALSTHRLLQ